MRILVIDIGTNSVRYLVCDIKGKSVTPIERGGEITRLGRGLNSSGLLDSKAISRTAEAVYREVRRGKELGAEILRLAATSAARDAHNTSDFVNAVKTICSIEPEILSGKEEAEAVYAGVSSQIDADFSSSVIIDIGGGSTEFIYPAGGEICFDSVNIGAVRMTEKFIYNDPPSKNEISEIRKHVIGELRNILQIKDLPEAGCIGVGGAVTTLTAIALGMTKYDGERVHNYFMKKESLKSILDMLLGMPLEERKQLDGLEPARADIIIAGAVILDTFLDLAGLTGLRVSDRGILFGLAIQTVKG